MTSAGTSTVSGSVTVTNPPSPVTGTVDVGNLPETQDVRVTDGIVSTIPGAATTALNYTWAFDSPIPANDFRKAFLSDVLVSTVVVSAENDAGRDDLLRQRIHSAEFGSENQNLPNVTVIPFPQPVPIE